MGMAELHIEEDGNFALGSILRAAEIEFAEKGFDGAGMKALATRAGVSQSLLHYHFGSKATLYKSVIRGRSKLINDERIERLSTIDFGQDDALEQIFRALFVPALGPTGGGRAYARIFAGLIAGNERDRELVRECYDPTAMKFLDAIAKALGHEDHNISAQVYQFALGVLASAISKDGRIERLMGDETNKIEDNILVEKLVRFSVGGASALANSN